MVVQTMHRFLDLFRKKKQENITVVSGLPRSGTSLMMKMLEAGGIPPLTDNEREADEDNPKGYYEFERVKKLPDGDTDWLDEARGKTVKIISALLPYLPESRNFRIIFMQRDIKEILISQQKMLIRRGENLKQLDDRKLTELFSKHLNETEQWLQTHKHHLSCLNVNYNTLLNNSDAIVSEINSFLGNKLDTHAMRSVIDPSLYRNRV